MDLLSDIECTTKAEDMLQKARQPKPGGYSSILERWHCDYKYRNSLSLIEWTEEHKLLHDRIALENHSCVATRAEREFIQNSKHWIIKLNRHGAQQPSNQRPHFAQAKREGKRLHDEFLASTQQEKRTIPRSKYDSEKDERLRELKNMTAQSILEQAGGSTTSRRESCRLRPRQQTGTVTIGRREVGILHGLTICNLGPDSVAGRQASRQSVEDVANNGQHFGYGPDQFRLSGDENFPTTDGVCEQNTHSYSMY